MPPPTDHGDIIPLWYSFELVKKRVEEGGWTHQVTQRELPSSKDLAGVNMRLTAGSYRELHWHTADEWAYVLYGNARVTVMNPTARCSSPRTSSRMSRSMAPTHACGNCSSAPGLRQGEPGANSCREAGSPVACMRPWQAEPTRFKAGKKRFIPFQSSRRRCDCGSIRNSPLPPDTRRCGYRRWRG